MPHRLTMFWCMLLIGFVLCLPGQLDSTAQEGMPLISDVCPVARVQQHTSEFDGQGIILTYFDRFNIWAYDIQRNARYPLPETAPCGTNCHLSPDGRWFSFLDSTRRIFSKMRLNGAERTPLALYATEVSWWNEETLLVWTPTQDAYLRPEDGSNIIPLETRGIVSLQPGGKWAQRLEQRGDHFARVLVAIDVSGAMADTSERIELGLDRPYFNAASWSPDGHWLAFTAPLMTGNTGEAVSAEIFGIEPDSGMATAWTDLTAHYGPIRINGHAPSLLSWSPDNSRIAFWVIPLTGPDPETDTALASIHIFDVASGLLTRYCGFHTDEHTPNPPRLIWSPDGSYLAFGANLPNDERGYMLLTLDTRTGTFTELSAGLYPALGNADVIAWGLAP